MDKDKKSKNILRTWKEISKYLDCDVRTCRRWEKKFGLPVHRLSKSEKSRVFVYKHELDQWLNNEFRNSSSKRQSLIDFIRPRILIFFGVISAFIISLFVFLKIRDISHPAFPIDFKIQGSSLVLLDDQRKELWRYNTGDDGLIDSDSYKQHYQIKRNRNNVRDLPYIIIKDINYDGSPEVLFSIQTQTEFGEGDLLCFNYKGDLMWSFKTGRELRFGQKTYSANYRIHGFDVYDLNKDDKLEIVVISDHLPDFPTQLIVLNSQGEKLGEYWNSGRLVDFTYADLNNDMELELIVTGTNNEYRKPCLIILDTTQIEGTSPQSKRFFRCENLKAGRERYYVLFPKVELVSFEALMESISKIDILANNRLCAIAGISGIIYELDLELNLRDIRLSHGFQLKLQKAIADGRLKY
ncbi:MAG: hypothetical protein PVH84_16255, partial [Candidatus Aminicenantes bacterium]